jgi:hypothetical protein
VFDHKAGDASSPPAYHNHVEELSFLYISLHDIVY